MISVVVPVRNDPEHLRMCLQSLGRSGHADHEVIVVNDASTDSTAQVPGEFGVTLINLERRSGPGVARNHGARAARGEILVFVDADVRVHEDALAGFAQAFSEVPPPDAVFGAYDVSPPKRNLISQYKNLAHHLMHRDGAGEATTFWAGCGAVRRETFLSLGGFDSAYDRPSIEDIELGLRMSRAGLRVLLRPEIQGTHLKRWTLFGLLKSDFWDRAVPWTELILRDGQLPDTLNLKGVQRLSALLAYTACGMLAIAASFRPAAVLVPLLLFLFVWAADAASDADSHRTRSLLTVSSIGALMACALTGLTLGWWFFPVAAPVVLIVLLNREFYAFFWRQRGPFFALFVLPLHLGYFVYSGLALAFGTLRHILGITPSRARPTATPS